MTRKEHASCERSDHLHSDDLSEFVQCYNASNRHERTPTWDPEKDPERHWRKYGYTALIARDKTSLDVYVSVGSSEVALRTTDGPG